ncbi:MAG: Holliday junction ATP-dependent DNA helicase RuvB [Chlamydiae bacterium]|nr:Holliday junction ATP-dependent DNA helicase RuvB [Chlamydiota bacterium]
MPDSSIHSSWTEQDVVFEEPLRPHTLQDFMGQEHLRERLDVFVKAARGRSEPLGHCMLHGPPGLGKTTLAAILARAMDAHLITTSGPTIEKAGDLAGILTNLQEGDILFIDEIHRLSRTIEEYLYPAMEDFNLDLLIDSGPNSRSVRVKLNRFTLIGATTRVGLLTAPMRSRFALTCRLDYYTKETLSQIIKRSARILNVSITPEGAHEIASRCRGTPRIANHLLRWVRDFAQIHQISPIDKETTHQALTMLAIDSCGLDEMDKKILEVIIDHHDGGPVGLTTIAVAVGEDPVTLSEVYEPYLIMQGFIKRTPRGREVTPKAHAHLNKGVL